TPKTRNGKPKVKTKRSTKLLHPNSRTALNIVQQSRRHNLKLNKAKERASRLDSIVEKLLWFQSNLESDKCYSKFEYTELVERYFTRFNDELEQIEIIRSVGCRKPIQHGARERSIKLAQEHELMLFNSTGLELPDVFNKKNFREFMEWDGTPQTLPRLKLMRFVKPKVKT
uniref:Translation machinery-associated protein 16 n=1 Tax=Ciona intestinalis TaxID=7719 RepID=F6TBF1_CIOIN